MQLQIYKGMLCSFPLLKLEYVYTLHLHGHDQKVYCELLVQQTCIALLSMQGNSLEAITGAGGDKASIAANCMAWHHSSSA